MFQGARHCLYFPLECFYVVLEVSEFLERVVKAFDGSHPLGGLLGELGGLHLKRTSFLLYVLLGLKRLLRCSPKVKEGSGLKVERKIPKTNKDKR